MSLGGSDGWTESTTAVLSSRLSDAGKVVTIAAGNDGAWIVIQLTQCHTPLCRRAWTFLYFKPGKWYRRDFSGQC